MLRETDLERIAEVPIVCERVAADVCARLCDLRRDLVVRRRELCVRMVSSALTSSSFNSARSAVTMALPFARGIAGDEVIDTAALHDALMEQAVRRRGLHQRQTFIPPPDWPNSVTFSGSPPKFAIFS